MQKKSPLRWARKITARRRYHPYIQGHKGKRLALWNSDHQKSGPGEQELRPLRRGCENVAAGTKKGFSDVCSGPEKGIGGGKQLLRLWGKCRCWGHGDMNSKHTGTERHFFLSFTLQCPTDPSCQNVTRSRL